MNLKWILIIMCFFVELSFVLVFCPNNAYLEDVSLPVSTPSEQELTREGFDFPQIPRITAKQLKELLDKKADVLIVDSRNPAAFKFEHIKGAINIPEKPYGSSTEEMIMVRLLSLPRNKPIIIYCD